MPLKIISYEDLYGWSMDNIVKAVGLKNNCEHLIGWSAVASGLQWFCSSNAPYRHVLWRV